MNKGEFSSHLKYVDATASLKKKNPLDKENLRPASVLKVEHKIR